VRILHAVLSEGFYGSERYCIDLAIAQAQSGHEVMVLAQGRGSACVWQFEQAIADAAADLTISPARLSVLPQLLPAALHRPCAYIVLRRFRPDIVHSHLNPATRRVGAVARRLAIPHVTTLHLTYEDREHATCDGIICDTSWQRRAVPPQFRGQVTVVWPWLPSAIHAALAREYQTDVAALRRAWGAGESTTIFGSVGRLMPEKGMDLLVRAFRHAFPKGNESTGLVVVGGGPQENELRQLAAGDPRIVFAGTQHAIATYYRTFDVYVSAARFEPFGLTILEAMDAGCRLVVTRTDGPREFLKDRAVLWADPDDAATLADQLRAAVAAGRKRTSYDLADFTRERAAVAIEDFYREIIHAKASRR
jgi:glycosyltransferase involved in cell wall biosynthesis